MVEMRELLEKALGIANEVRDCNTTATPLPSDILKSNEI